MGAEAIGFLLINGAGTVGRKGLIEHRDRDLCLSDRNNDYMF